MGVGVNLESRLGSTFVGEKDLTITIVANCTEAGKHVLYIIKQVRPTHCSILIETDILKQSSVILIELVWCTLLEA